MRNPNLKSWDTIRQSLEFRDLTLLLLSAQSPIRWKIVHSDTSKTQGAGVGIKQCRYTVRWLWWSATQARSRIAAIAREYEEETMNHLAEAKLHAKRATGADGAEWAQFNALLAAAHTLIATVERIDKAAERAELEAERAELARAYQASRDLY